MNIVTRPRLATKHQAAIVLMAVLASGLIGTTAPTATALSFGTAPHAMHMLEQHGVESEYVQLWAGAWLHRDGWAGFEKGLNETHRGDRTPMIHFYYWGNHLTADCFHNGCDAPGGLRKDQAGWDRLADELAQRLDAEFHGEPVVIVLETEFNKAMRHSEDLDEALASKAQRFKERYAGAVVVLGLGNWGREDWHVFDRAAAACDEIGLQIMRGSHRDTPERVRTGPDDLLTGAREAQRLFGKPIFITDIAISSHGGPEYEAAQAEAIRRLFELAPELQAAGVHALVYRSLLDTPNADTSDYYGEAERYFGLVHTQNRTAKPAFYALVEGMKDQQTAASEADPAIVRPTRERPENWIGGLPFEGVIEPVPESPDDLPIDEWVAIP